MHDAWNREFFNFVPRDSSTGLESDRTVTIGFSTNQQCAYNISYHYQPASPGFETVPPILFIHPVGIGLASWFWEGLFAAYASTVSGERRGHPSLYAINLLGCGVTTEQNSAMEWTLDGTNGASPDSAPWLWVDQCESLMEHIRRCSTISTKVTVVAQGGLAPIAIQLAYRNPDSVHSLILTSPPLWSELTKAIPQASLDFNFKFLQGPLGRVAFSLLETRWAVEFFSNLFLFGSENTPCDSVWLDQALAEAGRVVRPPVQVFNAGYCQMQSYEHELCELQQPTLILQGRDDLRQRSEFEELMRCCQVEQLPGKNVLPWESPKEVASAMHAFLMQQQTQPATKV